MSIVISPLSVTLEIAYAIDGAPNIRLQHKGTLTIEPARLVIRAVNSIITGVRVEGPTIRKDGTRGATRCEGWGLYDFDQLPDWLRDIVAAEAAKGGHHFGGAA